jgi:predicted Zn-dependent protease
MVRALRAEARFADAERWCRALLAAAPKDSRWASELARIAQDAGDPVEAETRWHGALLASPGQVGALIGLAQALTGQHRFAEARAVLDELSAREPHRTEPVVTLVRTLMVEGDVEAAEHHARALIAHGAGGLEHHLLLGRVLEATAYGAAAADLYLELAAASPQALEPHLASGKLAARRGDFPTARGHFERALAIAPEHVEVHLGLAEALAELGLAKEAAATAEETVLLGPNQPRAHLGRAVVAEVLGQLDVARLAMLEARSALPWRVEPLLQLAQLVLRHGHAATAAAHGEALLAAHPRHLLARRTAFDVAMATDRHETARAILSTLAEQLPAHREVQRRLARFDWHDGAIDRARARSARITAHDPRIHGGPDLIDPTRIISQRRRERSAPS